MSLDNLKKVLKEGKLKIGADETLKSLKKMEAKEVFVSSSCPEELLEKIEKYCVLGGCTVSKLKENSKELGAACKKPFSINICCSIK